MMQVTMIRKAGSKTDWYERLGAIRAMFGREPQTVDAVVEKEITLTEKELAVFENSFLDDSEIIKANLDLMCVDGNQVWHCIALTSKTAKYKILVESDGATYARYTAIVNK